MTETTTQHAPYASANSVLDVVRRFRDRGLPEPVGNATLEQIGISHGNVPRTLQALKFLNLLDDKGRHTDSFNRLRRATTDEYPNVFAEIIRSAYNSIFQIVDPAQDELTSIDDAFRGYSPPSQRDRMVKLFMGLSHEAGLVPEEKLPKKQPRARRQQSTKRPTSQSSQQRQTSSKEEPQRGEPEGEKPKGEEPQREEPQHESEDATTDYRLIGVLIQQLPKEGTWSKKRRDLWIQTMTSAVDLVVEIEEPETTHDGESVAQLKQES